jgi:Xaa-Pro aminopeptidase
MRQAAAITSKAMLQSMKVSRVYRHEHLLAATVEYECKIRGAQRMAFPSVVGGGTNGSIVHYCRNDKPIDEKSLVLMDVGCEFHGYVSDMTRTWPPCGMFSPTQVFFISLPPPDFAVLYVDC